jgi:uncharacterized damage-inducible protein DinB
MPSQRPQPGDCPEYYFTYINQVPDGDVRAYLAAQHVEALRLFEGIAEAQSLHRYADGKWSIREVLAHISDCERLFTFRLFWFARNLDGSLPSFDQDTANTHAAADARTWADHLDEFRAVRLSTVRLVRGVPDAAWARSGIASDYAFTTRSLAWMAAGHVTHHLRLLGERYL